MELIGEAHLDVAEDNYKVVPLRDGILLLIGPHYVNIIKLGDSVLYSLQLGIYFYFIFIFNHFITLLITSILCFIL